MESQEPRAIKFNPPSTSPVGDQRGTIVNIASVSSMNGMGLAAYTPTKFAVIGITKNGAKFYGPSGIRCNAVSPGWTLTPLLDISMGKEGYDGSEESAVCSKISLGRFAFSQE